MLQQKALSALLPLPTLDTVTSLLAIWMQLATNRLEALWLGSFCVQWFACPPRLCLEVLGWPG